MGSLLLTLVPRPGDVLYCTVLYCTVLYCTVLYCTVLLAGYEDDVYLLVKLGEAALVVFIIFAVVAILYMIVSCCLAAARNQK